MSENASIGQVGEKVAEDWLANRGYEILGRNYRKKFGEIDIIAKKQGILHFVEVKASRFVADSAFLPEIRVNWKKARKLRNICKIYIQELAVPDEIPWQIDVAAVLLGEDNQVKSFEFFENAVFEKNY